MDHRFVCHFRKCRLCHSVPETEPRESLTATARRIDPWQAFRAGILVMAQLKTFLAQNQFISNSVIGIPMAESAGATPCPQPAAPAEAIQSSDGGVEGHVQSHALGLPPKYNRCGKRKPEGALPEGFGASKDEPAGIKPGSSETAAIDSCQEPVAADISDIPEIFHWVRKLLAEDDRRAENFVNWQELEAAIDEELPLFIRDGDHLKRWSA
jgi:hypothetical protein